MLVLVAGLVSAVSASWPCARHCPGCSVKMSEVDQVLVGAEAVVENGGVINVVRQTPLVVRHCPSGPSPCPVHVHACSPALDCPSVFGLLVPCCGMRVWDVYVFLACMLPDRYLRPRANCQCSVCALLRGRGVVQVCPHFPSGAAGHRARSPLPVLCAMSTGCSCATDHQGVGRGMVFLQQYVGGWVGGWVGVPGCNIRVLEAPYTVW